VTGPISGSEAAPKPPASTATGIADYEFVQSLGAGPRGDVFLARRPARLPLDAEVVAVKVLRAVSTSDTFRRATEDLRFFAAQRSPYLVTLYDVGQEAGVFYCSMEHIPGGTLAAPADPTRALRGVADAARAASDLHAVGLVHRGITPRNVLVAPYGAKLADPNLSHLFTPGLLVPAGGSAATVEYSDPDLLRGAPARPHHDVWSLGALLHRVAAGVGLYGDLPADGLAALRRILPATVSISSALPAPLGDLVRACLAPATERPSAAEVADRLDQMHRR
jgi:serine/threonine protein kinase